MNNPCEPKPTITKSAHVGTVVQEYMDNLLVDLFPDVTNDLDETSVADVIASESVVPELAEAATESFLETETETEPSMVEVSSVPEPAFETEPETEPLETTIPDKTLASAEPEVEPTTVTEPQESIAEQVTVKPESLRYPQAPVWAQESFDVLLFDVCGLKLAVPMEALGKIIKVEHETNQLIGRPDWFIGAYTDNDQHLYVVDTAKYIMPEKGFDLEKEGFEYVIQLQRSKWTLACKTVHSTVRLEPDQVKWRSQQGKRQWLSGTVVDHMCALIHVDSLIDLLQAEAK